VTRSADMTYDAAVTRDAIEGIWRHWTRKAGTILVPGHDVPMVQEDGRIRYLGKREAAIQAWLAENLEETTSFQLVLPQ
jgi:hypothetical protein